MTGKNRLWNFNDETQCFGRVINRFYRVEIIEQVVRGMNPPSFIAALTPDGRYEYNGQIYESEEAFNGVLDKQLFERQTERARVIVLD